MNARNWFERLLDNVADRGLELIGLRDRGERDAPSDAELCHRLVEGLGEASNIALAREILQRWATMDEARRLEFLQILAVELDPDPKAIAQAAADYQPREPAALRRLLEASEPPRQELLRRLNMAPDGTAALVDIRAFLLRILPENPQLQGVDDDFQHLLASWFNRGFLRLERIDWNSPAAILEKLIRYEAVHPMSGWDDLRRRLGPDRRCFAFFHPALPQDPLIFVEVALSNAVSSTQGLRKASGEEATARQLKRLLGRQSDALKQAAGCDDPLEALDRLLQLPPDESQQALLDPVLSDLTLFYLTRLKRSDAAYDPVAHFHLSNGARL
ncbi:MAG: malonyl-CoA decarboxylase family protein [Candidatus Thiodiazotropha sp.]